MKVTVREIGDRDREWIRQRTKLMWGADIVVTRGSVYEPAELSGFAALRAGDPCGLATYRIEGDECELVTLDVLLPGRRIGTSLLRAVEAKATKAGCARVWLITTNDDLDALRFYQLRGYTLVAVYPDEIAKSRELKPEIPAKGRDGIPIRDEIELEKRL